MATSLENPFHNPEVRLECLRMAARPGLSPHEVVAVAREYLNWVAGVPQPTTSQGAGTKGAPTGPGQPDKPPSKGRG